VASARFKIPRADSPPPYSYLCVIQSKAKNPGSFFASLAVPPRPSIRQFFWCSIVARCEPGSAVKEVAAVAQENGGNENQHYVPRFLLRNFSEQDKKQKDDKIWAFDKSNSSIFCTNLRNLAAERGFYDIEGDEGLAATESLLSELEDQAARALRKIVEDRGLGKLSSAERQWLSIFCAVQFLRVRNAREKQMFLNDSLKKKIIESGGDVNSVLGFNPMSAKDLKELAVILMWRAAKEFAPHFANKVCLLLETRPSDPFFVSDNPIALHNQNDFGPYGNLGLAVPGIEIYFPITPTLTLTFFEPSILERLDTLSRDGKELIIAAQTGGIAHCADEHVMFLNSLQVINASRFVMSVTRNFALATRMLAEKPHLRLPPLFEIA
jgi:hypothetical protein